MTTSRELATRTVNLRRLNADCVSLRTLLGRRAIATPADGTVRLGTITATESDLYVWVTCDGGGRWRSGDVVRLVTDD